MYYNLPTTSHREPRHNGPFSFWPKTNAIITPSIPHIDRALNNVRFEIRSDLDDVLQFLMHGGAEPLQALLTSSNLR